MLAIWWVWMQKCKQYHVYVYSASEIDKIGKKMQYYKTNLSKDLAFYF